MGFQCVLHIISIYDTHIYSIILLLTSHINIDI